VFAFFFGVTGGDFRPVAERFIAHTRIDQTIRGVVGMGQRRTTTARARFGFRGTRRLADAV
jgi:hypothetical protein